MLLPSEDQVGSKKAGLHGPGMKGTCEPLRKLISGGLKRISYFMTPSALGVATLALANAAAQELVCPGAGAG